METNKRIVAIQLMEVKNNYVYPERLFLTNAQKSHIITKMSQVIMKITYKEIFYDSLEKRLKMYPNYFLNYVVET